MSINVRYAQDIPEPVVAPPIVPKDGSAGAAGVAGAAGADLTYLPPQYLTAAASEAITLDLSVSRQFRITANGVFSITFSNMIDGAKCTVAVIQTASGPFTPTFTQEMMWNLNAGAPTLADTDGNHSTYGFEYWGLTVDAFDAYLLGKDQRPFAA